MNGDARNKLDVSVFRQFRRLTDQDLKWILPRPTTSSSAEDIDVPESDEEMDVSAAEKVKK